MKAKVTQLRNGVIIDVFTVEVTVVRNVYTTMFPEAIVFETGDVITTEYLLED